MVLVRAGYWYYLAICLACVIMELVVQIELSLVLEELAKSPLTYIKPIIYCNLYIWKYAALKRCDYFLDTLYFLDSIALAGKPYKKACNCVIILKMYV